MTEGKCPALKALASGKREWSFTMILAGFVKRDSCRKDAANNDPYRRALASAERQGGRGREIKESDSISVKIATLARQLGNLEGCFSISRLRGTETQ